MATTNDKQLLDLMRTVSFHLNNILAKYDVIELETIVNEICVEHKDAFGLSLYGEISNDPEYDEKYGEHLVG